jgi:DNA-binding CsgD family transcriptional regulator
MVLVAHQEAMVAEGIAAALARFPGLVPAAVTTSAAEAAVKGERVDAVALHDQLPGVERAAATLRSRGVRVVLVAAGSIGEAGDPAEAEVRVSTGAAVASLAEALVPGLATGVRPTARLTARERQVLGLVARGLAAKQVARQLGISAKTVERHKTRMFSKLGVANQTAAVNVALRAGLVKDPTWA